MHGTTYPNFIQENAMADADFEIDCDENYIPIPEPSSSRQSCQNTHVGDEDQKMNAFRDYIANNVLFAR